ncbi:MAG: DUF455 family protein [Gemmatimonadales bacterium]
MSASELPPQSENSQGESPARESHVKVVDRWRECTNFPPDHPERLVEFLHRQMNEEANVMENAASSLVDFPEADWSIRKSLARQCADEARHTLIYKRLLEKRGGRVGQYPVLNFQYKTIRKIDSLIGRLAVENRTFEADGLDAVTYGLTQAEQSGDAELWAVYDAQQADEIRHVGFANEYIRRQIRKDPRSALEMARALTDSMQAFKETFDDGGTLVSEYGIAHDERRMAGFDAGEIEVAHEQAEARRAAVRQQLTCT